MPKANRANRRNYGVIKTLCKLCKSEDAEIFKKNKDEFVVNCFNCKKKYTPNRDVYEKLDFKFTYCRRIKFIEKELKKREYRKEYMKPDSSSKSNLIRRYKNEYAWKQECKKRRMRNELRELKEKASFKPRTILRKTKPVAVALTEGVSNESTNR